MKKKISIRNHGIKYVFIMSCVCSIMACNKEVQPSVDDNEALNIVNTAITSPESGIVSQIENSVSIAARYNQIFNCGRAKDSMFEHKYSGLGIVYDLHINWNWKLLCTLTIPSKWQMSYNGTYVYNSPMTSYNYHLASSMELSGLEYSAKDYSISKQLIQEGKYSSSAGSQNYISTSSFNTTNLVADKATGKIKSGTMDVVITISGFPSFRYEGNLVFNGNNTATLTLNRNNIYTLKW